MAQYTPPTLHSSAWDRERDGQGAGEELVQRNGEAKNQNEGASKWT